MCGSHTLTGMLGVFYWRDQWLWAESRQGNRSVQFSEAGAVGFLACFLFCFGFALYCISQSLAAYFAQVFCFPSIPDSQQTGLFSIILCFHKERHSKSISSTSSIFFSFPVPYSQTKKKKKKRVLNKSELHTLILCNPHSNLQGIVCSVLDLRTTLLCP